MLNNINMEFIQAFNPLYAVPIVAVIFCAFIVYAFGFKSPVPPPSFDGIEEEKKYSKKRKAKEIQKSNKLLQNGKLNGNAVNKSNVVSSTKKKEASEKNAAIEKPINIEKSTVVEKKANKKNKLQNEKKTPQERKKENVPHDDLNDDGWVQLISKKGRKNRKRDVSVSETQSNTTTLAKVEETNKSNDSSQVEESPKRNVELPKDNSFDQKQPTSLSKAKANTTKEEGLISNVEKPKMQNIVVEVPKSDNNNIEKQPVKEAAQKGSKVLEESNKSKKKKKKNVESSAPENESTGKIISNVSESSAVKVISESPASQETTNINPTIVAEISQSTGKVEVDRPSEVKSSNVAFDELAGLYPETKEQKKKKKVRRDH